MKGKTVKRNWSGKTNTLSFSSVFFICIFVFLVGLFCYNFLFHSQGDENDIRPRPMTRLLEKSAKEETEYNLLRAGESGDDSITSIPFQVLSWRPRALYFPNFATSEQCNSIINMARGRLKPSQVKLRKGETEESAKGVRTSSGVFISASQDKTGLLDAIEEKIARATKLPRSHAEAYNILRYEVGQRYASHYDTFDPAEHGPQESKRMATFLVYLSDVPEGGETMFPFENGLNMDGSYNYEDCIGLRVRPRKGDGILFYSLFPNGTVDPTSLHGSCPVIKGRKWVATKWIRDQEVNKSIR